MTTLILMRHAKSDWGTAGAADFDRPLNKRGRRAAPDMGQWLAARPFAPRVVVTSPAVRALETARAVVAEFDEAHRPEMVLDERIYEASVQDLLAVVADHLREDPLMIVGHNPGLEQLLAYLVESQSTLPAEGKLFPTAAIYVLAPGVDGPVTTAGGASVVAHMRPSMLPGF